MLRLDQRLLRLIQRGWVSCVSKARAEPWPCFDKSPTHAAWFAALARSRWSFLSPHHSSAFLSVLTADVERAGLGTYFLLQLFTQVAVHFGDDHLGAANEASGGIDRDHGGS